MRRGAALGLLVGLAAAVSPGHARPTQDCAAPAELVQDDPQLLHVKKALQSRKPLKIVALGGGSTAGAAAGDPDRTWPRRLEEELSRRRPDAEVTVLNKGVARQTAEDMLRRIAMEVLPEKPTLVVWEVGITDAVRGVEIDEYTQALQAGVEKLREAKIDTILMDMQFARPATAVINYERYLEAMRRVADVNDLPLFRRWEIMRYWGETGAFDYERVPKEERASHAARVYECLAQRLADAILWAAK